LKKLPMVMLLGYLAALRFAEGALSGMRKAYRGD
jgi:hypothetical protein